MFIKVQILGELEREPEMYYTNQGRAIVSMTLRVITCVENEEGASIEQKSWLRVVAWDELAEQCSAYLRKDMTVFVEGNLRILSYRGESRYRHRTIDVIAKHIEPVAEEHIC